MTAGARAFARRCADATRGGMPESAVWERIAARGQEWPAGPPCPAGVMEPGMCFTNAATVVLLSDDGCRYAEGFAQGVLGLWYHHAWVVTPDGLASDPTWTDGSGTRYVGVTLDLEMGAGDRPAGLCQLTRRPVGIAWGPDLSLPGAENLLASTRGAS